jgi:hypothetical protein
VPFWLLIAAVVALTVINYLITPKPKTPKPDSVKDLDDPTSEAGRPVPVPFGTITIKGLNLLWFGDKGKRTYKVDA